MEKRIEIRVAGTVASGKTSIALLIQAMLKDTLGIDVPIEGSDTSPAALLEHQKRLWGREGRLAFLEALQEKNVQISLVEGINLSQPIREGIDRG